MKMMRVAAAISAAVLLVAGLAPAAQATTAIISVGPGSVPGSLLITYTLPSYVGFHIAPASLNPLSCSGGDFINATGGPGSGMGYVYADGSGSQEVTFLTEWYSGGPEADVPIEPGILYVVCEGYEGTLVFGMSADAAPPIAAAPLIPAWVQAHGRATQTTTCIDGWNPSWQAWAQPATGGWVCTRSIPSLG